MKAWVARAAIPAPTTPMIAVRPSASPRIRTQRVTWMTAISRVRLWARSAPRYSSVSVLGSVARASSSRIGAP